MYGKVMSRNLPICHRHNKRHRPTHCKWCGAELPGAKSWYCNAICGLRQYEQNNWSAARAATLKIQGRFCQECGVAEEHQNHYPKMSNLEVHHWVEVNGGPRAGYANRPENLVVLCHDCHQRAHHPPRTDLVYAPLFGRFYPKS